jgi:hypothetical protein
MLSMMLCLEMADGKNRKMQAQVKFPSWSIQAHAMPGQQEAPGITKSLNTSRFSLDLLAKEEHRESHHDRDRLVRGWRDRCFGD